MRWVTSSADGTRACSTPRRAWCAVQHMIAVKCPSCTWVLTGNPGGNWTTEAELQRLAGIYAGLPTTLEQDQALLTDTGTESCSHGVCGLTCLPLILSLLGVHERL